MRGDATLPHYSLNPEVIEARIARLQNAVRGGERLYRTVHFADRAVVLDAVQQVYRNCCN